MRKADYTLLAYILMAEIDGAKRMQKNARHLGESDRAGERLEMATRIAESFTEHAHVDRVAFLRTCGIEPG